MTAEQIDAAERLLSEGCSVSETARSVGVTDMTIHKRFPGRAWSRTQIAQHAVLCRRLGGALK